MCFSDFFIRFLAFRKISDERVADLFENGKIRRNNQNSILKISELDTSDFLKELFATLEEENKILL